MTVHVTDGQAQGNRAKDQSYRQKVPFGMLVLMVFALTLGLGGGAASIAVFAHDPLSEPLDKLFNVLISMFSFGCVTLIGLIGKQVLAKKGVDDQVS